MNFPRVIIVLLVFFVFAASLISNQTEETGSSYSAKPRGSKAFFTLLKKTHPNTSSWLKPFAELDTKTTGQLMFIISPEEFAGEDSLISWIAAGNTAIAFSSSTSHPLFYKLFIDLKIYQNGTFVPPTSELLISPKPAQGNCKANTKLCNLKISSSFSPSIEAKDRFKTLATSESGDNVIELEIEKGKLIFFSSCAPIINQNIDKLDNLEFLLNLFEKNSHIFFDEFHHGHRASTPQERKLEEQHIVLFLFILLLALLISTLSRSIRFGPAQEKERALENIDMEFISAAGLFYQNKKE